jgi:hypothetical protein
VAEVRYAWDSDDGSDAVRRQSAWVKRNGDFIAIAVLTGFITALIFIVAFDADVPRPAKPFNFGFDRGMDCEPVGLGEPVCVRRR